MAQHITLPIESLTQHSELDGILYYEVIVSLDKLPDKISLAPNVRQPNHLSALSKEFLRTLQYTPELWYSRSSELVIIASQVEINYNKRQEGIAIKIKIQTEAEKGKNLIGDGLLDGGHRWKMAAIARLRKWDLSKAKQKINIMVNAQDDVIRQTSVCRNTSHLLDKQSQVNILGKFDFFKEQLKDYEHNIKFYKNEDLTLDSISKDGRSSISHILRLVLCLDVQTYNYQKLKGFKHPLGLVTSGAVLSDTKIERAKELFELFSDAFWLEKQIYLKLHNLAQHNHKGGIAHLGKFVQNSKNIKQNIGLIDGTRLPYKVHATFSLPLISAFRSYIDEDSGTWREDFFSFAPQLLSYLWKVYLELLKAEIKSGNTSFTTVVRNQGIWQTLIQQAIYYQMDNSIAS